jgi:NAD(P)H-dependent flavin oxidoreductase YrpB (nitropropane dioxygenase family)
LRNRFTEEYAGPEPLAWPLQSAAAGDIYAASQARDDGDYSPLFAGQGLRMLDKEQGAAEIVEEIVTRASDLLNVPSATKQDR